MTRKILLANFLCKNGQRSHATRLLITLLVATSMFSVGQFSVTTNVISASANTPNPVITWNQFTTTLGLQHNVPAPYLARDYALVHVAMYDALLQTINQNNGNPSQAAIVAGATSEVLTHLFPDSAAEISTVEASQIASIQGYDDGQIISGSSIGHHVGKKVVAYAKTDGSDAVWDGIIPTGDCKWTGVNPIGPMFGLQKTFILTSGAEFQPELPYACGSLEDLADIQMVIEAHNNLTPEQIAIAHKWADLPPPTIWNNMLNDRISSKNLGIFDAARASAYLNVGMYDAFVSCWYTKMGNPDTYWTARPFQRIPDFTSVIPTPNFPSYTSGHSTISSAASLIMGQLFPDEASFFIAQAQEAAISRLWGGIHFPQDNDNGFAVGAQIGNKVVNDMQGPPHPFVHPRGQTE